MLRSIQMKTFVSNQDDHSDHRNWYKKCIHFLISIRLYACTLVYWTGNNALA